MAIKNGDLATLVYVPGAFEEAFGSYASSLVNHRIRVGNKRQHAPNGKYGARWYIDVLEGEHKGVTLWVYECMIRTCIFA